MTKTELIELIDIGVLRYDLVAKYPTFLNLALREIQNLRSWSFMKKRDIFPITSGTSVLTLPANFKELQNLRPPVHIRLSDPSFGTFVYKPVTVVTENQERARIWSFGAVTWDARLSLKKEGTTATLELVDLASEDLNFEVKYYQYLPDLTADSDESSIANAYPWMVVTKAKEHAFRAINDFTMVEAMREEFMSADGKGGLFREAVRQDSRVDIAGLDTRM